MDVIEAAVALRDTFVKAHGPDGLRALQQVCGIPAVEGMPRLKSYTKRSRRSREQQRHDLSQTFLSNPDREYHVSYFDDFYEKRSHLNGDLHILKEDEAIEQGARGVGYWRLHSRLRALSASS